MSHIHFKVQTCAGGHNSLPFNMSLSRVEQSRGRVMGTLYFHCVGTQEALLDRKGSEMDDLFDARGRAFQLIQAFIASDGPEDWREWTVHVSNAEGDEVLEVPFTSVLGKTH